MDDNCFNTYFKVKKIRGRNETDIYKNYIKDLPEAQIQKFFEVNFANTKLCTKDDNISAKFRQHGNTSSKCGSYLDALSYLSKSLAYATYNGEAFAFALANRSQNFLELGDLENCIYDVDLCLKAKYPDLVKPTLWIRKAECFRRLNRCSEMKTTLLNVLTLIDNMKNLPHEIAEKYKKNITNMLKGISVGNIERNKVDIPNFNKLPEMTQSSSFLSASSKVELRYTKRLGRHVIAAQKISKGEAIFIEKSYTFAPLYNQDGFLNMCSNYCQYCLKQLDNSIPCKECVTYVYCNEACRDAAWNEFHRWECLAVQANIFKYIRKAHIALRIIMKAAHKGFNRVLAVSECDMSTFGDKTNNYPYFYNSSSIISTLPQSILMQLAGIAALLVNYLKLKTDFFEWLKEQPGCGNKDDTVLMHEVGALIIRHCAELPNRFLTIKSYDSTNLVDEECLPITTDIALAVCPSVITLRHSCVPNTSQYFLGNTLVVKALTDIVPNQEIFMAYLDINYITMNMQERMESLEKNCSVKCKCIACIDPTLDLTAFDSLKCIKCGGRAPIVYANKNIGRLECLCRHCNFRFILPGEVMQQITLYGEIWRNFEKTREMKYLNECVEVCKRIYASSHKVFNMIFWQLLKCFVMEGNLSEAVRMGMRLREFAHRRVIYSTAFECGIQVYLVCKFILEHFNHAAAYTMDIQELGQAIANVSSFLDEAKLIFELHYPPNVSHLQKLQYLLEFYISIYTKRLDEPPDTAK